MDWIVVRWLDPFVALHQTQYHMTIHHLTFISLHPTPQAKRYSSRTLTSPPHSQRIAGCEAQLSFQTMIPSRRAAAPARTLLRYQQPRRFASSTPHGEHHHAEPVNETFGVSNLPSLHHPL